MPDPSRSEATPLSARQVRELAEAGAAPAGGVPTYWDPTSDFAGYVRSLREQRGWTTRDAALRFGKSQAYVSRLEHLDRHRAPGMDVVRLIADVYAIDLREVLHRAGYRFELPPSFADALDAERAFEKLVGDPRFVPPGYQPEYAKLLAPEVKRYLVHVAIRSARATRAGDLDVEAWLGRSTGGAR